VEDIHSYWVRRAILSDREGHRTGGIDAAQIAVLDVASGIWKTLIRGASQAQYVPSGHLVYVAGGALWAVRFELTDLQTHGTAAVVVPQIVTLPTGTAEFDIARTGTLVYVARGGAAASPRTLVWVDRQGREESIPGLPERSYSVVRLSPDGTRVALEIKDQQNDIWVWDLARHILTRVTIDPGLDESPVWMPDGRRLVFAVSRGWRAWVALLASRRWNRYRRALDERQTHPARLDRPG
jgi:hypothetical protein